MAADWGDIDARLSPAPLPSDGLAEQLRRLGRRERVQRSTRRRSEAAINSGSSSDEVLRRPPSPSHYEKWIPSPRIGFADRALSTDVPLGSETLLNLLAIIGGERLGPTGWSPSPVPSRSVAGRSSPPESRPPRRTRCSCAEKKKEGRLDIAGSRSRASRRMTRRLLDDYGQRPQPLPRRLASRCNNVGNIAEAEGDSPPPARPTPKAHFTIARRLLDDDYGEQPQSPADLAIRVIKVGNVAEAEAASPALGQAYTESLQLARPTRHHTATPPSTPRPLGSA